MKLLFISVVCLLLHVSSSKQPGCAPAQRQAIRDICSQDLVLRHLTSGALNKTLNPCSNFHRHICPNEGMTSRASIIGLIQEFLEIEKLCTEYDVYSKIVEDFKFAHKFDRFNYSNLYTLYSILYPLPKTVLLSIYEFTILHVNNPLEFYRTVWNTQYWTPEIDVETFPAKYDPTIFANQSSRERFVYFLAANLSQIFVANGGPQEMRKVLLDFMKDVTDYNLAVHVMYREGIERGPIRNRMEDFSAISVAAEYGRVLKNTPWSSVEYNGKSRFDIFKERLLDIYHTTLDSNLDNIGTQNASITLPRDFYVFYEEERAKLSSLMTLPYLRNFLSVLKAHERTLTTFKLDLPMRWGVVQGSVPNSLNTYLVWMCVQSEAINDLVLHASPDAAVFGLISFAAGHELYHHVQALYKEIMPDSPVVAASSICVNFLYSDVAARFPEDERFSPAAEEEADVYGIQIAYGAFVKDMGSKIDDIIYPSLNITNRQLFFYANSIFGCNIHDGINTRHQFIPSAHHQVNGRVVQMKDFTSTFGCSATDRMVFPDSELCPIFFVNLAEFI